MANALVVDDEPNIRYIASYYLRNWGYAVMEAGAVAEARPLLRRELDVVVLDIHLPNGDGADVLAALMEIRDDVPVVVMTGFPDSAERLRELCPLAAVLIKPFEAAKFMDAITKAAMLRAEWKRLQETRRRCDDLLKEGGSNETQRFSQGAAPARDRSHRMR